MSKFVVKKISNKIEIEDMEINDSNACKAIYEKTGDFYEYDCGRDCWNPFKPAEASVIY